MRDTLLLLPVYLPIQLSDFCAMYVPAYHPPRKKITQSATYILGKAGLNSKVGVCGKTLQAVYQAVL